MIKKTVVSIHLSENRIYRVSLGLFEMVTAGALCLAVSGFVGYQISQSSSQVQSTQNPIVAKIDLKNEANREAIATNEAPKPQVKIARSVSSTTAKSASFKDFGEGNYLVKELSSKIEEGRLSLSFFLSKETESAESKTGRMIIELRDEANNVVKTSAPEEYSFKFGRYSNFSFSDLKEKGIKSFTVILKDEISDFSKNFPLN